MKIHILFIMSATILLAFKINSDNNIATARDISKDFGSQLKSELMKGMKSGGPEEAIEVCYSKAPKIAENLSDSTGWKVGRTSLKIRNINNAPDEWETEILRSFEQQKLDGVNVSELEFADTVLVNNDQYFRYMKAIPTGSVCLNCHGLKIKDPIRESISKLYSDDKAIDYNMGEIRGAFTLSKKLD